MQYKIIAVGQKMPAWCQIACNDYLTRLQRFLKCTFSEIPTAQRHKNLLANQYIEEEGRKILAKISPLDHVVALEIAGRPWSTAKLAENMGKYQQNARDVVFVIGGPDGLSAACLKRAQEQWSLSALTFPHPLVRVLLLEQLYRASSLLANHPYHRE